MTHEGGRPDAERTATGVKNDPVWTPADIKEKTLTHLVKQAAALRPKS
jgi:hypothetical protein